MSSSTTTRVAPDIRLPEDWEGGVRPAARWPASVRSRRPSWELSAAAAMVPASAFFPVAVRALRLLGLPAARGVSSPSDGARFFADFRLPDPVLAMAGN